MNRVMKIVFTINFDFVHRSHHNSIHSILHSIGLKNTVLFINLIEWETRINSYRKSLTQISTKYLKNTFP